MSHSYTFTSSPRRRTEGTVSRRKTRGQLYRERNVYATGLAVFVRRVYGGGAGGWYRDPENKHGWPVVWIVLPDDNGTGQAGVHVHPSMIPLLESSILPNTPPPGGYDGHTRIDRLNRMATHIHDSEL